MPTTWNGMTRVLVEGVPVWRNGAGELFFYDQNADQPALKIGTSSDGFVEDWQSLLEERLVTYRAAQTARPRASARKQN
jgi:hypothetical protein